MGERLLEADCGNCAGLCCVAPAFAKSSDFAIDKPAGTACRNLGDDFRCRIHERLTESGFKGCVVFDCFGAGQRITQQTDGDWRTDKTTAAAMFASLPIVRQLHELMWYASDALKLDEARGVHGKLRAALAETDHLAGGTPAALKALDVDAHRGKVNQLLQKASHLARAGTKRADYRGVQLVGRKM